MRTPEINSALSRTLTMERLEKYLNESNGYLDAALQLYEENNKISEAFYTPLQCLEVCFRNNIHLRLTDSYGERWFEGSKVPFTTDGTQMVSDALKQLKQPVRPGSVVAELKFAFWISLLGHKYDADLWRKVLHKGFAGTERRRKIIHKRLNVVRRFRNRIAHHEPVFHRPLVDLHREVLEAIGWMCPHTAAWARYHSRVLEVIANSPALRARHPLPP